MKQLQSKKKVLSVQKVTNEEDFLRFDENLQSYDEIDCEEIIDQTVAKQVKFPRTRLVTKMPQPGRVKNKDTKKRTENSLLYAHINEFFFSHEER